MFRVLLQVAAAIFAAALLWRIRVILPPFLLAVAIVYILSPFVSCLEQRGMKRMPAILLVYAVILTILVGAVAYLVPLLLRELNALGDDIPGLFREFQKFLDTLQQGYARFQISEGLRDVVDDTIQGLEEQVLTLTRNAIAGLLAFFSSLLLMIISPIIAFYILKDLHTIREWVYRHLPRDAKSQWWALLDSLDAVLNGFIRGQLIVALLVGILSALALSLLGVRFALILGLIAGIFEIVPYFGPILGGIPAVGIALLESPLLALKVFLAFFVIQQLESAVLSPWIIGDRVGLHPVAVVLAVLTGGHLYGFWGIILAVPGVAVLKILGNALWDAAVTTGIYRELARTGDIEDEAFGEPEEDDGES